MADAVAQEQNGAERADNRGRGLGVVGLGLYKSRTTLLDDCSTYVATLSIHRIWSSPNPWCKLVEVSDAWSTRLTYLSHRCNVTPVLHAKSLLK